LRATEFWPMLKPEKAKLGGAIMSGGTGLSGIIRAQSDRALWRGPDLLGAG
jgi:hypothetical protein